MRAQDFRLLDYISGKNDTFLIPTYQRKYKWTFRDEVKTLLEDLIEFSTSDRKQFYFGCLVVKKNNHFDSKLVLVDGQQRITTFFLILAALKHVLKNTDINPSESLVKLETRVDIHLETSENKFKLERINDEHIIKKILNGQIDSIHTDANAKTSNYFLVFKSLIHHFKQQDQTFWNNFYYEMLYKTKVAIVSLEHHDDENLVFESINSKEVILSASDLIKNYCLMNLDERFHHQFENDIIEIIGEDCDSFYRQILGVLTGSLLPRKSKKMYLKFKDLFKPQTINETFINDLTKHLTIWKYIHQYDFRSTGLPFRKSAFLNFYAIMHAIIYKNSAMGIEGLKFVNNFNKNDINEIAAQLSEAILKRALAGFGRVESSKKFVRIAYEIFKAGGSVANFNKLFVYNLKHSHQNDRIPQWHEIEESINKMDLYSKHKDILKWSLIAYEQKLSKNLQFDPSTISIEHIFPQNPGKDWNQAEKIKMMGVMNTLGNLSITNNNSALGNKLFKSKKRILEERSYLKINKLIYQVDNWNYDAITNRSKKLITIFKEMWNATG